jgi:hypothetical protein
MRLPWPHPSVFALTLGIGLSLLAEHTEAEGRKAQTRSARAGSSGRLGRELQEVAKAWGPGAQTAQLPARFLQRGETVPVPLPALRGDCVTLLALSAPNISFVLSLDRRVTKEESATQSDSAAGGFPLPSHAGLVELTRCGKRRSQLSRAMLTMRSPRGTVQFLVAAGPAPALSATSVLSDREPGPEAPLRRIGARPGLGPLEERLEARTQAHRARSAQSVTRLELRRESQLLRVGPGCHRVDVLAGEWEGSTPDLDARLVDPETGRVTAEDETTTSDPMLVFCQAEGTHLRLEVQPNGSAGERAGLLASWPLPRGLPVTWGRKARSAMARALFDPDFGFKSISDRPDSSSLGVAGVTGLFVPTQPGACYRVAVAAFQGELSQLALGLQSGLLSRQAREGPNSGAQLSFCAKETGTAKLEVQAVGTGLVWLLASWRLPTPATLERSP